MCINHSKTKPISPDTTTVKQVTQREEKIILTSFIFNSLKLTQ